MGAFRRRLNGLGDRVSALDGGDTDQRDHNLANRGLGEAEHAPYHVLFLGLHLAVRSGRLHHRDDFFTQRERILGGVPHPPSQ